jgi:uncharacterized protein
MNNGMYYEIEQFMKNRMDDSIHDCHHIYRVLYMALDIGSNEDIDMDVLITSSLLHDIGRDAEYKDPNCDHAVVGSNIAYEFLLELGWGKNKASHVKDCILTHRYRADSPPKSLEAKIVFDADTLDISGAIGIARTLQFGGIINEPLYLVDINGNVLDGCRQKGVSFFDIVNNKLLKLESKLYTNRAKEICKDRRKICLQFYESMFKEINDLHNRGIELLRDYFDKNR